MQDHIEHEFLELNDCRADAAACLPPSVRVKTRVALGLDHDARRVPFHVSIEHTPDSSGVIYGCHEDDGADRVLIAPRRKNPALAFGSGFAPGNLHHIRYTEPSELPDLPCRQILVREAAADELEIL